MQSIADLPLVAGHVALDFVNTAEDCGQPDAIDYLETPADLRVWGERYGLLEAGVARDDDATELKRAVAARELLYEVLLRCSQGERPDESQLAELERLATAAYASATLGLRDGRVEWRWSESELASVRHTAVSAAIELLRNGRTERVKQCPGDHCGWYFLDTTKRGNRRWCSMHTCGQDAKDAQRRARRQADRATG
jgi:predicted RNA-binding Zn ribbon-like protein